MFGSQIWKPYYGIHNQKVEAVNHKFLRYLSFKIGSPMSYLDHDYFEVASRFNIFTFKSQFEYNDVLFVKKVLLGLIDSDVIRSLFAHRHLDYNLLFSRYLHEPISRFNYTFNAVTNRLRRSYNIMPLNLTSIDDITSFKCSLSKYLYKFT